MYEALSLFFQGILLISFTEGTEEKRVPPLSLTEHLTDNSGPGSAFELKSNKGPSRHSKDSHYQESRRTVPLCLGVRLALAGPTQKLELNFLEET